MTAINIREFTHNLSKYLKKVKNGENIILMERNIPIADIIPHNENITLPGWKRTIKKVELDGEPFAETIIKNRRDESH